MNIKKTYWQIMTILVVNLTFSHLSFAQSDSTKPQLQISGYAELYYNFDFANPQNHDRPNFLYSFNRHNEVNLNLGFLKANYSTENVRANLAIGTGTYMHANYIAEPDVLKNIYEANAGFKISKNKNLWVDAGIFGSHIGFESAIGKDCWNITRSILAENSPYFESGVKIGYTSDNNKWFLSGLILNGWQRIQRVNGNNTPAFGHQITFKPNERITLNSSSFIGNDKPDSLKQMRYFHNFFGQFQVSNQFSFIVGFDIGAEQKINGGKHYNTWNSPIVIAKYSITEKSVIAGRLEYYSDKNGVIVSSNTSNGFKTFGYSLNHDYKIKENLVWRAEVRGFESKDPIFNKDGLQSHSNLSISTSLAISF